MPILLAAPTAQVAGGDRMSFAVALYNQVCLRAFPDDAAVDALMTGSTTTKLGDADTREQLGDVPGRGWAIGSGSGRYVLLLEPPPFHSCSVRFLMPDGNSDLSPYAAVVDAHVAGRPGFLRLPPVDHHTESLHRHIEGYVQETPSGPETLLVVALHVTDATRRAAGETAVSLRFMRQIVSAPQGGK